MELNSKNKIGSPVQLTNLPPRCQEHQEKLKGLFWFKNKNRVFTFELLGELGVLVADELSELDIKNCFKLLLLIIPGKNIMEQNEK